MKIAVFGTKPYDRSFLTAANRSRGHEMVFFEPNLKQETLPLAIGFPAVCVFVNDTLDAAVLKTLAEQGTKLIALRCAGFNNVDLNAAKDLGMTVLRVPAYSPHAVAEHAVALILALNRRIHRSYLRTREGNFSLDGLLGFDLYGRTVGVVGTGKIGETFSKIMLGFGCKVLAYDPIVNQECVKMGVQYGSLEELYKASDIVSLHCPLLPATHHIIDAKALKQMKKGVMLINTGRGALIDTKVAIEALKSGKIGYLGLDVYEEESGIFFEDLSNRVIQDDVFSRLLTFHNVIITGHQAFFTENAMRAISETTLSNVTEFEEGGACANEVKPVRTKK